MATPLAVKNAYDEMDSVEAQASAGVPPDKAELDRVIADVEKAIRAPSTPRQDKLALHAQLDRVKRLSPPVKHTSHTPSRTPVASKRGGKKPPSALRFATPVAQMAELDHPPERDLKRELEARMDTYYGEIVKARDTGEALAALDKLNTVAQQYAEHGWGSFAELTSAARAEVQRKASPTVVEPVPPLAEERVVVIEQPPDTSDTVEIVVPRDSPPPLLEPGTPFHQIAYPERVVAHSSASGGEREQELYNDSLALINEGISRADSGDLTSAEYEAAVSKYRVAVAQVKIGRDQRSELRRRFGEFEQAAQTLANKPLPSAPSASASSSSYAGPPAQSRYDAGAYRPSAFNIGTIGGGLLSTLLYGAVGFGIGFGVGEVLDDTLIDTFQKSRTLFVVTGAFVGMGLGMVIADTLQLSDLIVKYYYW